VEGTLLKENDQTKGSLIVYQKPQLVPPPSLVRLSFLLQGNVSLLTGFLPFIDQPVLWEHDQCLGAPITMTACIIAFFHIWWARRNKYPNYQHQGPDDITNHPTTFLNGPATTSQSPGGSSIEVSRTVTDWIL